MVFCYSSPNWIDTCYFLLTSWGCPHWFLLQTVHQLAWDLLLKYQVLLCFNFYEQLNIPLILLLSEVLSLFTATDLLIYCTSKSYLHTHTWKPVQQTKSIQFQRTDSIIPLRINTWLLSLCSFLCDFFTNLSRYAIHFYTFSHSIYIIFNNPLILNFLVI